MVLGPEGEPRWITTALKSCEAGEEDWPFDSSTDHWRSDNEEERDLNIIQNTEKPLSHSED